MTDRSTAFEVSLALGGLLSMVGGLVVFAAYVSHLYGAILGALWALMAFRLHFQLWWLKAHGSFAYICWRFPHALLWTHAAHLHKAGCGALPPQVGEGRKTNPTGLVIIHMKESVSVSEVHQPEVNRTGLS